MVHTFTIDGKYLVFDVESGSLHLCDEPSYRVIRHLCGQGDLKGVSKSDREAAMEDIEFLKYQKCLFTPPVKAEMDVEPGEIKALCLHISHDCNLACTYCFAGGGNYCGEKGNMPLEVAKAAVDFLMRKSGKIKNLEMDFFGGEPLLNLGVVKETVEYAKARAAEHGKNIKFTLTTNTLLLDDETTRFLNEEMDNVVLSIDGRPEIHDAVRKTRNGKGSFAPVLEHCKKFRSVRGDKSYYVRGTFTAKNLDFAEDVLFLNDQGFDQISIEPVVLDAGDPLALSEEHLEKINSEYERLAIEYVKRRRTDKWFNFFHFMIDLKGGPCLKKRLTGCGAGNNYLAVTPNGNIYPCHRFAENLEYKLGNVFEGTLDNELRAKFSHSNLLTKPDCEGCFAKYICSGGCAANSIFQCGDINKPYKLSCEMMRKRTECALYVYAMEHNGN